MTECKRWLERWACSSPAELEAKLGELESDAAQLVKLECELEVFRALIRKRWVAIAGPTDVNHLYDAYTQGRDLLDDIRRSLAAEDDHPRVVVQPVHVKQCRLCANFSPDKHTRDGTCEADEANPVRVGAYFSCAQFTEKTMCCQSCEHWRRIMTGNRCGAPGAVHLGEVGPEFVCDSWKRKDA